MIKNKVLGDWFGLMEESMKESGRRIYNTEMGDIKTRRDNGLMANGQVGKK